MKPTVHRAHRECPSPDPDRSAPARRRARAVGALVLATLPLAGAAAPAAFNVLDFGAVGDGVTMDTAALQRAIAGAGEKGGTVHLPAGRYLTGTLVLTNHLTLFLDSGAVLLGSTNLPDYPSMVPAIRSYTDQYTERSLLYGENLEDVAITGRGTIDGRGGSFRGPYKVRPYLLRLIGSRRLAVDGITFRDSPMWVQHYLACDDVLIRGITVRSRCNANNDGIDLDGCQRVRISDCDIWSGDDAIVLKSTLDRACRDVVVINCLLSSDCNAFKLGTESNGGFDNILLSNCALTETRLAGLAIELVDGGVLERVSIDHVSMRDVRCPIFIRLGNRARPFRVGQEPPGMGVLRNVRISHVQADGADAIGCSITGLPNQPAQDIVLDDIRIAFQGGGKAFDAGRPVPEHAEKYPEYSMFGALPAYGFYCRHVRGLRMSRIELSVSAPDTRPALMFEDVLALELEAVRVEVGTSASRLGVFRNVRQARVEPLRHPGGQPGRMRVEGIDSADLRFKLDPGPDVTRLLDVAPEVPATALIPAKP